MTPASLPFPGAQEVLTLEVESNLAKREAVIDSVLRALDKHGFEVDEFFERLQARPVAIDNDAKDDSWEI